MDSRPYRSALGAVAVLCVTALPGCFHCDCGPSRCGDLACGTGETCEDCPSDCSCARCGDLLCDGVAESCSACPFDCGACPMVCGDGLCVPGEGCDSCPPDCGLCPACVCGDSVCDWECGESCDTCTDCDECEECWCGNSLCEKWCEEDWNWCPQDCEAPECFCGNGLCEPSCMEDCGSCADCQCPCACGDGICDALCGEDCLTCTSDCGPCLYALHDYFAPGAPIGPAALGGAQVVFMLTPGSFDWVVSCVPALPDAPGSGSTSYTVMLADDDDAAGIALPFMFTFFGASWTTLFVGSNGSVTFGTGDAFAPSSEPAFHALPRAAPLAADLAGGTVIVDEAVTRVTITWQGWVDAFTGAPVADFQVTLWSVGDVRFAWSSGGLGESAFVGLSDGSGAGMLVDLVPPGGC